MAMRPNAESKSNARRIRPKTEKECFWFAVLQALHTVKGCSESFRSHLLQDRSRAKNGCTSGRVTVLKSGITIVFTLQKWQKWRYCSGVTNWPCCDTAGETPCGHCTKILACFDRSPGVVFAQYDDARRQRREEAAIVAAVRAAAVAKTKAADPPPPAPAGPPPPAPVAPPVGDSIPPGAPPGAPPLALGIDTGAAVTSTAPRVTTPAPGRAVLCHGGSCNRCNRRAPHGRSVFNGRILISC